MHGTAHPVHALAGHYWLLLEGAVAIFLRVMKSNLFYTLRAITRIFVVSPTDFVPEASFTVFVPEGV